MNKLFKKSVAIVASMGVLASTINVTALGASLVNEEFSLAYTWGYDAGVTTMSSEEAFMPYSNMTREQVAKMAYNGLDAASCVALEMTRDYADNFSDLDSADASLQSWIETAYEYGLVNGWDGAYHPMETVTRGQFMTMIGRALYGQLPEPAEYWKNYYSLLNAEGIFTVENAWAPVKRYEAMLVLYRIAQNCDNGTDTNIDDILCQILDTCEGTVDPVDPEVVDGFVTISLVDAPSTQDVPRNAIGINVGTFKLTAGADGAKVSSIVIDRSGLGEYGDIDGVWFANDSMVTKSYAVTSSNTATVRFSPALELGANQSAEFDVMVALDAMSTVNSTHKFTATTVNVANGEADGTPVSLGTIKTTSYEVDDVDGTISLDDVDSGKLDQVLGTVTLTPNSDANIRGFVLNQIDATLGTDVNTNLDEIFANVDVYYNDEMVGSAFVTNDKIVVTGLDVDADDGEAIEFELRGDVIYVGEGAEFALELDAGDFSAIDVVDADSDYGMRLAASDDDEASLSDFDLTLTKVANPDTIAPGSNNVVLYQATLKSSSDFTLTNFTLEDVLGGDINAFTSEKVTLYVDGVDFELDDTSDFGMTSTQDFDDEIYIDAGRTVTIKVTANVKSASALATLGLSGTDLDYQLEFLIDEIENSDGDDVDVNISKKGDKATIEAGTAIVKAATVAAPVSSTLYSNADQEIGRFAVRADAEDLKLKEVTFDVTLTTGAVEDLLSDGDVTLVDVANGTEISATTEVVGTGLTGTIKFSGMSYTIAEDATVNFKVMGDFANVSDYDGTTLQLSIADEDAIELRNSSTEAEVQAFTNLMLKEYTFGVQPPLVTLTKLDDNKFKVTIKNVDTEAEVNLSGFDARVRILAADADYEGTICILPEGSSVSDCADVASGATAGYASTGTGAVPGAITMFTLVDAPVVLAEDGGDISYEILVDSDFINPAVLRAEITKLYYNGGNESYSISAQ
ncbi:MAG: S-layer homology domain-containing protein [Candidatus Peribacteria bacterium]|nr:MAG: S-layer homology domain-containing protein [Candidatus Peribacteria bacterium]